MTQLVKYSGRQVVIHNQRPRMHALRHGLQHGSFLPSSWATLPAFGPQQLRCLAGRSDRSWGDLLSDAAELGRWVCVEARVANLLTFAGKKQSLAFQLCEIVRLDTAVHRDVAGKVGQSVKDAASAIIPSKEDTHVRKAQPVKQPSPDAEAKKVIRGGRIPWLSTYLYACFPIRLSAFLRCGLTTEGCMCRGIWGRSGGKNCFRHLLECLSEWTQKHRRGLGPRQFAVGE